MTFTLIAPGVRRGVHLRCCGWVVDQNRISIANNDANPAPIIRTAVKIPVCLGSCAVGAVIKNWFPGITGTIKTFPSFPATETGAVPPRRWLRQSHCFARSECVEGAVRRIGYSVHRRGFENVHLLPGTDAPVVISSSGQLNLASIDRAGNFDQGGSSPRRTIRVVPDL